MQIAEGVSGLLVADVPVVALSSLVVVAQDTNVVDDKHKMILVVMRRAADRLRHLPDHDLDKRMIVEIVPILNKKPRLRPHGSQGSRSLVVLSSRPTQKLAGALQ